MPIETTYRGYKITYGESSDQWGCYDLGGHGKDTHAPTLTELKAKLDKFLLTTRKKNAFSCMILRLESKTVEGRNASVSVAMMDASIIEYCGPKVETRITGLRIPRVVGHKVATTAARGHQGRLTRAETDMEYLAPLGEATDAAISEANRLGAIAEAALADFYKAYKAIPRVQLEDIDELVKISNLDTTGGL